MTGDRAAARYRKLYARLLRLYPEPFRSRFAESMEQTFNDLCRERRAAGGGLPVFVLGLFAETLASILAERTLPIMPSRKRIIRLALVTAFILSVPLTAMRFTDAVDWSPFDFAAAGVLVFGAGFAFEVVARRSGHVAYRVASGLACGAALLLVWINLAVGLIGSEHNPANALYLGVLAVGILGAAASRLHSRGMALALTATAVVQAAVPLLAILIWNPLATGQENLVGLIRALLLNAFFVLLFAASAILFRRAGDEPRPG